MQKIVIDVEDWGHKNPADAIKFIAEKMIENADKIAEKGNLFIDCYKTDKIDFEIKVK